MIDYRLYLVTDDPSRYRCDWIEKVVAAVEGGVTCVQYRDTENSREVQFERIRKLQDALKRFGTPLIVNNDAELAKAVGAQGVHVGQHDMPVPEVRKIVGSQVEIGLSITEKSQISNFIFQSADALGVGPVWDARKTKADASAAMGAAGFIEVCKSVKSVKSDLVDLQTYRPTDLQTYLPLIAIGGITLANAAEVIAAGATGIAVVSAFSQSADPYNTAKEFSLLFQ